MGPAGQRVFVREQVVLNLHRDLLRHTGGFQHQIKNNLSFLSCHANIFTPGGGSDSSLGEISPFQPPPPPTPLLSTWLVCLILSLLAVGHLLRVKYH